MLVLIVNLGCKENHNGKNYEVFLPKCRHDAIFCAITTGEHHPVRIATGFFTGDGIREPHAQAQYWNGNEWRFLTAEIGGIPMECEKNPNFEVVAYRLLTDYYINHFDSLYNINNKIQQQGVVDGYECTPYE